MSKITIAHGHQHASIYSIAVKPAVDYVNAAVIGVTITCNSTDSIKCNYSYDWVVEAEFENERAATLFLLSVGPEVREELQSRLRRPWRPETINACKELLLQMFTNNATTEMEST